MKESTTQIPREIPVVPASCCGPGQLANPLLGYYCFRGKAAAHLLQSAPSGKTVHDVKVHLAFNWCCLLGLASALPEPELPS